MAYPKNPLQCWIHTQYIFQAVVYSVIIHSEIGQKNFIFLQFIFLVLKSTLEGNNLFLCFKCEMFLI